MSIPAPKKTARALGTAFPVTPVSAATTDSAIRAASAALTSGKSTNRNVGRHADAATATSTPLSQARTAIAAGPSSVRAAVAQATPPKPMAAISKRKIFRDPASPVATPKAVAKKAAKKFNVGKNAGPTHVMNKSAGDGKIVSNAVAAANPLTTVGIRVKDGGGKSAAKKTAPKKAAAPAKKVAVKKAAAPAVKKVVAKKAVAKKAVVKAAAPAKKAVAKAPAKKTATKKK